MQLRTTAPVVLLTTCMALAQTQVPTPAINPASAVAASQPVEPVASSRVPITVPVLPNDPVVEGRLSLGGFYDTNVAELGRGTRLPTGFEHRHDYTTRLKADVGGAMPLSDVKVSGGKWTDKLLVGGGLTVSPRWESYNDKLDAVDYGSRIFVNWLASANVRLGLQYEFDYGDLDRSRFLTSHRLSPVATIAWQRQTVCDPMVDEDGYRRACQETGDEVRVTLDTFYTDMYYTWGDLDFSEKLSDARLARDGDQHIIGVRNTWLIERDVDLYSCVASRYAKEPPFRISPDEWLSVSVGYEYERADTRGGEFDGHMHSIISTLHLPLPLKTWSFDARSVLRWEDYGQPSIFSDDRDRRSDFVQNYQVGLTWVSAARNPECDPFAKCLRAFDYRDWEVRVTTGVGFTVADSNVTGSGQSVFEFDRAVYGVQVELHLRATRDMPGSRAVGGTNLTTGGKGIGPPPVKPISTLPPVDQGVGVAPPTNNWQYQPAR